MKSQLFNQSIAPSGYGMSLEAITNTSRFAPQIAFSPDDGTGAEMSAPASTPEVPVTPTATEPAPAPATQSGEDVTGLKRALDSERARAKQFEQQLKQMQESIKGIDPEKYKQLETLQKQAEEWNRKEIEIRQTYETEYNQRFQTEQEKTIAAEKRYNDLLMRTEAEKAFQGAKGRVGAGEDGTTFFETFFTNIRGRLQLTEKGSLEVIDANGTRLYSRKDASKLMSPAEFFGDLITHPVYGMFFERQNPGKGGGMNPGNVPSTITGGEDLSHLSPTERLTVMRERAKR